MSDTKHLISRRNSSPFKAAALFRIKEEREKEASLQREFKLKIAPYTKFQRSFSFQATKIDKESDFTQRPLSLHFVGELEMYFAPCSTHILPSLTATRVRSHYLAFMSAKVIQSRILQSRTWQIRGI